MNASLEIEVCRRASISYLKHCYFTTPFKVMNITEDKRSSTLHLMLMSSSPGILDGDTYNMKIAIAEQCSLQLHTQAYQRIFTMKQGAVQQMEVRLAPGASFCYLPHPAVPHQSSSFTGVNNFYLSNDCKFVYGEILTCGRKLNGELFSFLKYHSVNNVYVNNKLVVKENLLMQPNRIPPQAIGQLEGFTHQASLIYLQEKLPVNDFQQQLIELFTTVPDVEFGISKAPVNGLIIRLLGNGAEHLYHLLQQINLILSSAIRTTEVPQ